MGNSSEMWYTFSNAFFTKMRAIRVAKFSSVNLKI
jgi:hypothetical protein